jgi:hypothetical protein
MFSFYRDLARRLHSAKRQRLIRSRPALESVEGRVLLNGAVHHSAHHPAHVGHAAPVNPLTRYSIFEATITRGPHAGLVFEGPMVLGYNGRIQVNGDMFPATGRPILVVGTVYSGAVNLRFVLPGKFGTGSLEVVGNGTFRQVPRGIPNGLALIGSGNVAGPARTDSGHWVMLRPASHA